MAKIYLYAELLLNIRQVTVFAVLPSSCNETTHIKLRDDQRTLSLQHEKDKATIELPSIVVNKENLIIPTVPTRELSFRVAVGCVTKHTTQAKLATDSDIPWPATKLSSQTRINCQSCGSLLIEAGNVTVWKDLPSGGWADMMDFWHCHKPTTEDEAELSSGNNKGYSAANVMGPVLGTGLVDTSHLWFAFGQCRGIQRSLGRACVTCTSCREPVGIEDKRDDSIRLYKWSIAVQRTRDADWETYSAHEVVSRQLLALIEEQAVYKFVLYSENISDAREALFLWVFTPDLMYSTSTKPTQRAMKVFYMTVTDPSEDVQHGTKVEELQLPIYALKELQTSLQASTSTLPPSARKYQDWTIGLLDR